MHFPDAQMPAGVLPREAHREVSGEQLPVMRVSAEVYVHAGSRQFLQFARLVVEDEDRLAQVESAGRTSSAAIFCKLHLL